MGPQEPIEGGCPLLCTATGLAGSLEAWGGTGGAGAWDQGSGVVVGWLAGGREGAEAQRGCGEAQGLGGWGKPGVKPGCVGFFEYDCDSFAVLFF